MAGFRGLRRPGREFAPPPRHRSTPLSFDLMESTLGPRGPRYDVIESYPFTAREDGRGPITAMR